MADREEGAPSRRLPEGLKGARRPDEDALPTGASTSLVARLAMDEEESARERSSLWTAVWLSLLASIALQLAREKTVVHWILTGSVVLLCVTCAAVLFEARDGRDIGPGRILVTGVMVVLVTLAAAAHLGVLSPVLGFLIVTVYYNSSGDSPYDAVIYALSAIGYLVLIVLSLVGVLPLTDSVLAMAQQNNRALVGFGIVAEGILFATYKIAKQGRLATRTAMERLERAQQQVQQRDLLLLEARAELDGAQASRIGRHTGTRIGTYRVGEVIGRGATGEVYEAMDVETTEPCALKILYPHLLEDRTHVTRFQREAELTRQLDSPHIVQILGSGLTSDGCPYVAMELLVGEDLGQYLRNHRVMDASAVSELLLQVAQGLNLAQERGIVHRDLKPQNLFAVRERSGRRLWKVLDFGVAAVAEGAGDLTRGAAIGTPNYMSPEQTRGQSVDHQSDVFALGSIVYRALTGQPAFAAADSMATMYRVNHVQPCKPSLIAEVPDDIDAVVALALAKNKADRFRSANTFASAFRDAVRGELDPPFRAAAAAVLSKHGWLKEIRHVS